MMQFGFFFVNDIKKPISEGKQSEVVIPRFSLEKIQEEET